MRLSTLAMLILMLFGSALSAHADATPDWLMIPGKGAGPIRSTTTEKQLIAIYGAQRVKREQFRVVPDGDPVWVTTVWPQDPVRRARVVWKEGRIGQVPEMVIVEGSVSRWSVPPGITLGTAMSALEKLNGKPFSISGFGWDYGGGIDWKGGRLASTFQAHGVSFVLGGEHYDGLTETDKSAVLGEKQVLSTALAVRKMKPVVSRIIFNLR